MAIQNLVEHISELNQNIQAYLKNTLEYYKLLTFKNATKSAAFFIKLLVIGSFFSIFLLFISLAVAYMIGESLGHLSYGFFIVAAFYLLIFILLLVFNKQIFDRIILKEASKIAFGDDDEDDEKNQNLENQKSLVANE